MKLPGTRSATGMQRTLWRTHSVVCRRCKAEMPNLSGKRTEIYLTLIDLRWFTVPEQSIVGLLIFYSFI